MSSNTLDMFGWDGVNPPFQQANDLPFLIIPLGCTVL